MSEAAPRLDADVQRLRDFARQATAVSELAALRVVEGAGAAAWYRCLPELLGNGFHFHRRVSPDANDPVNVLLNIGFTMLYRHAILAYRATGLSR